MSASSSFSDEPIRGSQMHRSFAIAPVNAASGVSRMYSPAGRGLSNSARAYLQGKDVAQFQGGQVVPESGLYRVTHQLMHIGARDEYMLIRGRRFPTCPYCRPVSYELLQSHERYRRHRSRRGRPFSHYSDLHLSMPRVTA